jgi:hypothetical protein
MLVVLLNESIVATVIFVKVTSLSVLQTQNFWHMEYYYTTLKMEAKRSSKISETMEVSTRGHI